VSRSRSGPGWAERGDLAGIGHVVGVDDADEQPVVDDECQPAAGDRRRDLYHRLPDIQKKLVDIDGSVYWMLSHPRPAATLIGDWFSVSLAPADTTTTA